MKKSYIPEGCDQQGRLEPGYQKDRTGWPPGMLQDDSRELSKWLSQPTRAHSVGEPDDWDAAGVAEEGKSGTRMIGWLMVSVAFVGICAAVAYIVVDLVRMP